MNEAIKVLLIEDNAGDARLVREALSEPSACVHLEWADRLSLGLDVLASEAFDVVLLDLGLPDSEGLVTLSAVRAASPHVPVVVLSGMGDERFALEIVHAGAQDYLVKQHVNGHILTRCLRYAIERTRLEQRLHLAMKAANEGIWELDVASGAVVWNENYFRAFGRTADSGSTTQWWIEHIHPEDVSRVTRTLENALAGRGDAWEAEYRLRRPDGSWAEIYDRAVIARDASGCAVRVVGAMLDISEQRRAEEALREANRRLRQLSHDLLRAQDYERRRIARELHDSTSQLLAALSIDLSRLQDSWPDTDRKEQALTEAIELAAACSKEIRTVTYLLHPPLLEEAGLASALQSYAQGFNERTGILVEIGIQPDLGRLGGEMETALFRIVQEGLANVHKHSGSRVAAVKLERDASEVRLVLKDQGRGLPEELRTKEKGFVSFGVGILGMRERAEQLGGRLELESSNGGAQLTVTVPLVHPHE
jgi:two-component system, NarL family, sensor histidine kinase UhpB